MIKRLISIILVILSFTINVFSIDFKKVEFIEGVGNFDKSGNQPNYMRFWDGSNFLMFSIQNDSTIISTSIDGIHINNEYIVNRVINPKCIKNIGEVILVFQSAPNEAYMYQYGNYNNGNIIVLNHNYEIIREFSFGHYNEFIGYDASGMMYISDNDYSNITPEVARQGLSYMYVYKKYYTTRDGVEYTEIDPAVIDNTLLSYDMMLFELSIPVYNRENKTFTISGEKKNIKYETGAPLYARHTSGSAYYTSLSLFDKKTESTIMNISINGINGVDISGLYNITAWYNYDYLYVGECEKNFYRIPMQHLINNIHICFGDTLLIFEIPPTTENDRTLVPMRFLFEQMGADVDWDDDTQSITVTKDNYTVTFSIDNQTAIVNGVPKQMDVPARLISDKTMIPLRFLSEELGYTVTWDEETKTATITE